MAFSGMMSALRQVDETLTASFDCAFAAENNPWRHLGALAILCLTISVVTGIVAFALYDTSVSGAYQSGLRLQQDPLLLGRLLRGLHRYAADGFMLAPQTVPEGISDFATKVVPELQRRGIFRKEYEGKTLREHAGLKRPPNRHVKTAASVAVE